MLNRISIFILFIVAAGCQSSSNRVSNYSTTDSVVINRLIRKGDSIYSKKASYAGFLQSMELYDSAWQIAAQNNDTILLAATVFAKGRAFDAMNSNPQKTIDYYTQAAKLYASFPNKQKTALYIKHLVAHSYDKVKDSINCVKILNELFTEIKIKPDSLREKMGFIAEIALISSEVKNYVLADSILQHLTKRAWIKNDINEYDYLNHYYLTRARIGVLMNQNNKTPYLDSLENVLTNCQNLSDSMYYSYELYSLYKHAKNSNKENFYLQLNNSVSNKFNSPEKLREAQDKVAKMEVAAIEMQRKMEQEQALKTKKYSYVLASLLAIISALAVFLYKRNKEIKKKKDEAIVTNKELQQKNLQNELLNKEIHHRIKNNLQMILSLVYMQEKNTQTQETKTNLQDIRLRIENIAAMHQQLLEQNDNVVDLKKYILQLVNSVASLVGNGNEVFTHLDIDDIIIPVKQSFPIGLLLNEWITNSIKYAIPVAGTLAVYISVKRWNNYFVISYKDSGHAVNKTTIKAGLGMNIIDLLAAQLNGEWQRADEDYFNYQLTIPLHGE